MRTRGCPSSRRAVSSLGVVALSPILALGCAVGPDTPPATAPAPKQFAEPAPLTTSAEPAPDSPFWKELGDPILDHLVERALARNPDIALLTARIREARALAGVATAALLPEVDAGVSYTRSRVSVQSPSLARIGIDQFPSFTPDSDDFKTSLTTAYEVDIWGKYRRAREAAIFDLGASLEARRAAGLALAGDVAATYLDLRTLRRRRAIALRTLEARRVALELARARLASDLGNDLDVARAEAEVADTSAAIPDLDRLAALDLHRLDILSGLPPGALRSELAKLPDSPLSPFVVPVGVPASLLARRPDVREASNRLAAATARIGQAKADLFPQVVLSGEVGFEALNASRLFTNGAAYWLAGPSLRVPLFDAMRRADSWTAAEERADQALHVLEKSILVALAETEDALASLREESLRREQLALAVESSRRAARLARGKYGAGLVSYLDVIEAERALFLEEDALAEADRRRALASVALAKAVAGGWRVEEKLLPKLDR